VVDKGWCPFTHSYSCSRNCRGFVCKRREEKRREKEQKLLTVDIPHGLTFTGRIDTRVKEWEE